MRIAPSAATAMALALMLTGCGGSDGDSGGVVIPAPAPSPAPTPSPTPTPTPTPSPTPTPTPTPTPGSWSAAAAALFDVQPDIGACRAGTLKASVKADFLAALNDIRSRHGLAPVTYSNSEDEEEAQSSLMMAANVKLSHTPPTSWLCYSTAGANGAGTSNLIGGWGTGLGFDSEDDLLAGWLREGGTPDLGHRRWILHPYLGKTSYGRVSALLPDGRRTTTASMRVFDFAGGTPTNISAPPFVGFPQGDYPRRYFALTDYLSFSVVPPAGGGSARSVDFSAATISVQSVAGPLTVTDVSSDNDGYGIANNMQWRVTGLQANVSYTVTISNIRNAPQASYNYAFRIQ